MDNQQNTQQDPFGVISNSLTGLYNAYVLTSSAMQAGSPDALAIAQQAIEEGLRAADTASNVLVKLAEQVGSYRQALMNYRQQLAPPPTPTPTITGFLPPLPQQAGNGATTPAQAPAPYYQPTPPPNGSGASPFARPLINNMPPPPTNTAGTIEFVPDKRDPSIGTLRQQPPDPNATILIDGVPLALGNLGRVGPNDGYPAEAPGQGDVDTGGSSGRRGRGTPVRL